MATVSTNKPGTPSRFFRSVNLERDHRDPSAAAGYLLTAAGKRALRRVRPNRQDRSTPQARTLTGPYGTGKSAFALFAIQLLAPNGFPGHTSARHALNDHDRALCAELFPSSRSTPGLWPVVVTGSREPIQVALLRSLRESLGHFKHRQVSGLLNRVTRALHAATSNGERGARPIIEVLSEAIDIVCSGPGAPGGFFIVIDELGKLLEYAAAHPRESDLQVLQELAEFAVRSPKPLLLLTILHQDFAAYADRLTSAERVEWEKIRGRFEDIVFEEPADELLRLVAQACQSLGSEAGGAAASKEQPAWFRSLCDRAQKLGLAPPGITKAEFEALLRQCWPLHPLVSVLIGQVFRKLAQNERSAFSFLASSEPHGLCEFLRERSGAPSTAYTLDRLYDYLVNALGDGLYAQRHGKRWAEIESALDRLPSADDTAIALLKTIGVLSAMGEWRGIAGTPELLEFALSGAASSDAVREALRFLEQASVVTARKYNRSFGLWEGSDVDIDERVREARDRLEGARSTAALAAKYVSPRPLVARRHSFDTGTLRYFMVSFVDPAGLTEAVNEPLTDADGRVLIVLPENVRHAEEVVDAATTQPIASHVELLLALPKDVKALGSAVRELACLEWVRENTPALEGDATARRELRARFAEMQRRLDAVVGEMLTPSDAATRACRWFHGGREITLRTRRELHGYVSHMCKRLFPKTPVILNELVNRRELSSAAAAGRRNLIQAMIERGDKADVGIEGYPPEKSMYLSVLSESGIHRQKGGRWGFHRPSEKASAGMIAVWDRMQEFFDESARAPQPVSTLFAALSGRPYGVREGPLPILFCAALIASDSDVALYEQGSFVPQLSVATFERLMKAPQAFTVRRWRVTGVRATVFQQLADMLGRTGNFGEVTKENVLRVIRPLYRFLSQLKEYVRYTERISPQARRIRDAIATAREADQLLFVALPEACGIAPIEPEGRRSKEELEAFFATLREGLGELQRCYDELIADLGQALGNAFGISGSLASIRTGLRGRAESLRSWVSDPLLRNLVERVTEPSLDDTAWVETVAALLAEKLPAAWRDSDRGKFEFGLAKVARLFRHLESLAYSASNGNGAADVEALRIGVTTRDLPELERVVHVEPGTRVEVDRLEQAMREALREAGVNGNKDLVLVALARLTKEILSSERSHD